MQINCREFAAAQACGATALSTARVRKALG